ncbi:MAG TPA: ABC transporter permease [Solirubrobacteraceae bacterium]|jgi:ABC-2 type transport system permease protein|nr:ABC transporter permease [Solirubrobacteraceae bacterium]
MSRRRLLIISRHQAKLLLGNPGALVIFVIIPLLTMVIMKTTQKAALLGAGYHHVNGAEQAVPGFTVMFAFFWLVFVGRTFFAEHAWGTWDRLQMMASTPEVIVGKLLPSFIVINVQMIMLFAIGDLVLGMNSKGSLATLVILAPALSICVLALTFALVSFCQTMTQLDASSNLLMLVFASLGGALALTTALPGWAQSIAPAIPSHWAMQASTDVILKGDGFGSVLGSVAVLLAFAAGFMALAALRFRPTDRKLVA